MTIIDFRMTIGDLAVTHQIKTGGDQTAILSQGLKLH
jgi:hypothetical protein